MTLTESQMLHNNTAPFWRGCHPNYHITQYVTEKVMICETTQSHELIKGTSTSPSFIHVLSDKKLALQKYRTQTRSSFFVVSFFIAFAIKRQINRAYSCAPCCSSSSSLFPLPLPTCQSEHRRYQMAPRCCCCFSSHRSSIM